MKIKGLFHIHSSYSFDSELELERTRDVLRRRGYSFAVICDHGKDLAGEFFPAWREECRRLSDGDFVFIPGLEFEFGSAHILGVGVPEYFEPESLETCLKAIKYQGGLTLWAHPDLKHLEAVRPYLPLLDGVEVWSVRYGTKYAPSISLCDFVKEARQGGVDLRAYAGLDAHKGAEIKDLYIEMSPPVMDEANVMKLLSEGEFALRFRRLCLPSDASYTPWQRVLFPLLYGGYKGLETVIDRFNNRKKQITESTEKM